MPHDCRYATAATIVSQSRYSFIDSRCVLYVFSCSRCCSKQIPILSFFFGASVSVLGCMCVCVYMCVLFVCTPMRVEDEWNEWNKGEIERERERTRTNRIKQVTNAAPHQHHHHRAAELGSGNNRRIGQRTCKSMCTVICSVWSCQQNGIIFHSLFSSHLVPHRHRF